MTLATNFAVSDIKTIEKATNKHLIQDNTFNLDTQNALEKSCTIKTCNTKTLTNVIAITLFLPTLVKILLEPSSKLLKALNN